MRKTEGLEEMNRVLKYPGSKWNIAKALVELIPEHHSYLEPFAGSMAVLFNKPPSAIETVNDLDSNVTNLFACIQEDSEKLARLVMTTPYSRQIYDESYKMDPAMEILLGADRFHKACQFLIKCWMGYGSRTNGHKVGWKNDVQGRERMYALWSWYCLPEWIIEVAERLRCIQIECRPAIEVIQRFDYENVFMYLDPPYLLHTRSAKQYKHEMTDADHEELLKITLQSKAKVMISGYESEMYNDYLSSWKKKTFNSCAEYGGSRKEVIWMNYEPIGRQITLSELLD